MDNEQCTCRGTIENRQWTMDSGNGRWIWTWKNGQWTRILTDNEHGQRRWKTDKENQQ